MEKKTILVYAHWETLSEPMLMGNLMVTPSRGKEIFSFEYNEKWLYSRHAQIVDPDLNLYRGLQYTHDEKSNFGIFLDSSPDRWGRLLMRRREIALARSAKIKPRSLFESDYLLGVYDASRMGGLRFKLEEGGDFLDNNKSMVVPPWEFLRDLEYASLQLERNDAMEDADYIKWLNLLMAPGSSLGGARPKANVLAQDNKLWIAKFPSQYDDKDIGAWEMVAYELAIRSGITMSEAKAQKFSNDQHTFLTRRFDRTPEGKRIHFASAMTLLGYTDGVDYQDGASYLHIVEFIMQNGAQVENDLKELWTRIVFNICVSNTDDHLRNHGFLLTSTGWVLSPAFDINPTEAGYGLKLNINEEENSLDLELAKEVGEYFRLELPAMNEIIDHVLTQTAKWREIANGYGIPRLEQERMEAAFLGRS